MRRLFSATISFEYADAQCEKWLDMKIAPQAELWWDPRAPEQIELFKSWVQISNEFYTALTWRPIRLDIRVLRALKHSPLSLDLYAWLIYRTHTVNLSGKPITLSWKQLQGQLGTDYTETKELARYAKKAIREIEAILKGVYPGWRIEFPRGRLRIFPSFRLVEGDG